MFLEDPGHSPYDLRFTLFDTPVRVHISFWIGAALFGSAYLDMGIGYLLLWVACVFVSVLVHEFGHVLMGRVFGQPGNIVLYGMGGLAINSGGRTPWQQIAVSLAGPGAGFILFGAALAVAALYDPEGAADAPWAILQGYAVGLRGVNPYLAMFLSDLLFVNFVWGLFNLLPVWPLDGGMVCRQACMLVRRESAVRTSLVVSLVTAGVICANAVIYAVQKQKLIPYLPTGMYIALFMGILAFGSYQLLLTTPARQHHRRWDDDDARDRVPWERDADWWKR